MEQFMLSNTPAENRHYEEKIYPNGNIYKGEIKNGQRDGIG